MRPFALISAGNLTPGVLLLGNHFRFANRKERKEKEIPFEKWRECTFQFLPMFPLHLMEERYKQNASLYFPATSNFWKLKSHKASQHCNSDSYQFHLNPPMASLNISVSITVLLRVQMPKPYETGSDQRNSTLKVLLQKNRLSKRNKNVWRFLFHLCGKGCFCCYKKVCEMLAIL